MVTKHNMAARSERHSIVLPPLSSLSTKREQYKALHNMKVSKLTDVNTYCRRALKTTPTVNRTIGHFSQVREKDVACSIDVVNCLTYKMTQCSTGLYTSLHKSNCYTLI